MKLKDIFWLLLGLALFGGLVYKIGKHVVRDHLLKTKAVHIKGVIIDDKNYSRNSPVTHPFTYSYRFLVDGRSYENNSYDPSLRVGDSVEVEYVKGWPSLNRAVHPWD